MQTIVWSKQIGGFSSCQDSGSKWPVQVQRINNTSFIKRDCLTVKSKMKQQHTALDTSVLQFSSIHYIHSNRVDGGIELIIGLIFLHILYDGNASLWLCCCGTWPCTRNIDFNMNRGKFVPVSVQGQAEVAGCLEVKAWRRGSGYNKVRVGLRRLL